MSPDRRLQRQGGEGTPNAKRHKAAFTIKTIVSRPTSSAAADPLLSRLVKEIVEGGSFGFSPKLLPYVPEGEASAIVSVRGGLGEDALLWGLGLDGVSMHISEGSFNPMVETLFGQMLNKAHIPVIHGLNHFLTPSADVTRGGFEPISSPGTIVCSFFPLVNNQPSPMLNRVEHRELVKEGDVLNYNDRFWEDQKLFRNQKNGGKMVLMEVCIKVPEFMLKQSQQAPHRDAVHFFHNHGCGVGGDFMKMTLYKGYVSALVTMLTSPMVKTAKLYGFHPLFIVRNVLLTNSAAYGFRGMHFVTVDKQAKSSILFAGFWRMRDNDPDKLEVIAVDADGSFVTHSSVFD